MSIGSWIDKQNTVRYYLTLKRNANLKYDTAWTNYKDIIEWNEPDTKGQILKESTYMRYPE